MRKLLLSGNEAVALGAYEAGVKVGAGYPGTPSTEILEALTAYPEVYTEWSVNEKVALELGIGAAISGARTLVTMKHVGLNVASDPLFTASYIGVKGGLVIVCADDPDMHSSQNEQDNRHYAYAAKVPMLDPSDSQEAKDFTKRAFELSEAYDTPVILRTTTRISHSKGIVTPSPNPERDRPVEGFRRNIEKYVMIPSYARARHVEVEKRMRRLERDVNGMDLNRIEAGDPDLGFVTSGVCYTYVKEAFPRASVLKLGVVHPLPEEIVRDFCGRVKRVFVVEELDPFFELRIRAMGFPVEGKAHFPITGELNPDLIAQPLEALGFRSGTTSVTGLSSGMKLPPRPPTLCPGCPHRTVFNILKKLELTVTGDIGCYTLGALPPFTSIDTCIEMGGSIGIAQGIEIAQSAFLRTSAQETELPETSVSEIAYASGDLGQDGKKPAVAVLGDSTFAHSGLTGLLNAAYNKRKSLIIVLDNGTTAMTGLQPNPLSGTRINGEETVALDYVKLADACGLSPENVRIVDAYKPDALEEAIVALLKTGKLSLLVAKGLCMILKRKRKGA
jgi:indolepyruvate ferredoxin oxidoreductase alpha subunit